VGFASEGVGRGLGADREEADPGGMTARKAKAKKKQIPGGMTARKARAKKKQIPAG
jgi:hypothetical protein